MLAILEALKTQVPGLVEGGALDPEEEISILGASRAAWRGGWEHLHTRRPWALAVPRRGRSWSRRGHTCWILTDCTTLGRAAGAWPQHLPVGARRQRPPLGAPLELGPGTRPSELALSTVGVGGCCDDWLRREKNSLQEGCAARVDLRGWREGRRMELLGFVWARDWSRWIGYGWLENVGLFGLKWA